MCQVHEVLMWSLNYFLVLYATSLNDKWFDWPSRCFKTTYVSPVLIPASTYIAI